MLLRWLEHRLTFVPSKEWAQPLTVVPNTEEVTFTAEDGTRLSGAWFPHPTPAGAIVFCHGNAGNLVDRIHLAAAWRQALGYSVFLFDYRGYGKSDGSPSEAGLLLDTRAAYHQVRQLSGVTPILAGRSLGTVPATLLASEVAPPALILDSPLASASAMARKILPIPGIHWFVTFQLNNVENITRIDCPLIILHGDADEVVPFDHGRLVFDAAPDPKQFIPLLGMGHNDDRSDARTIRALRLFLASLPD